jgi:cytosine/adenosine deaminase-related metal-dependent hydrolase
VLHEPEELFSAATVNGMRALGWEAGELRPGMLADFVTLRRPDADRREIGLAQLIYACGGRDVTNVVVGGETVVSK